MKKIKSVKASPKNQAKKEKAAAVRRKPKNRHKGTKKDIEKKETHKSKTKINAKSIIALVIIAVIAFCFFLGIQNTDTPQTDDKHTVKTGDKVYIKFTQKLENGTILDTNYEDIAKEAGIVKNKYPPLRFIVGKGQVPGGLENALVGMKAGGKKTVILEPKDAYGEYKTELAGVADRVQYRERNLTVVNHEHLASREFTELFRKTVAILGDTVSTHAISWNYTITDVKPDNITVKAIIKRGSVHKLPDIPWNCTAIEVGEYETIFRQDPPEGTVTPTQLGNATVTTSDDAIILTINPEIGDVYLLDGIPAKVTKLSETHITLDANHPLAGKIMIFDIELLQITKVAAD